MVSRKLTCERARYTRAREDEPHPQGSECKMGAYGSKQFRADLEALRANDPTLHSLNYEQASLGDEGAAALAEALQVNRTVRRLQLGQCGISGVGVGRLGRALCENRVLPCKLRRLDLVSVRSLCR